MSQFKRHIKRQIMAQVREEAMTQLPQFWAQLCGLRFKDRVRLAVWLIFKQSDIKKGIASK